MKSKKNTIGKADYILSAISVVIILAVALIVVTGKSKPAVAAEKNLSQSIQIEVEPATDITFPFEGVVTGSAVRLRQQPHVSSKIFEEMKRGSQVTVLALVGEKETGWYKVQKGELIGFVSTEYVLPAQG